MHSNPLDYIKGIIGKSIKGEEKEVVLAYLDHMQAVGVIKRKKGIPTVIEVNGETYILRHRDQRNR